MFHDDGSVGGCYDRHFSSNHEVSVIHSQKAQTCLSDRYLASTQKVSVVTPTNGPVTVDYTPQQCDSASEALCNRDLVPSRVELVLKTAVLANKIDTYWPCMSSWLVPRRSYLRRLAAPGTRCALRALRALRARFSFFFFSFLFSFLGV